MSKSAVIASIKLRTLSVETISYEKMKQWKWRDREPAKVLQRFIELNRESFAFLGIQAMVETRDFKPVVVMRTSEYVGSAPIFSPMTGKPEGDISIGGRFGEAADQIVAFLQDEVAPEFSERLQLVYSGKILPPCYIECIRYLETYLEAHRYHWQKFESRIEYNRSPLGMTDWREYVLRTASDSSERMRFKNNRNHLTVNHPEWRELTFVAKLSLEMLAKPSCPARIRYAYESLIRNARRLADGVSPKAVDKIVVHMSDPEVIRRLKSIGNNVLGYRSSVQMAWRIDFNRVFECYVQHIFAELALKRSMTIINNPRYPVVGKGLPQWGLRYIEPDMILRQGEQQIVVDAKYKSHLYNVNSSGDMEVVKEAFRHDMHQILAYTAFNDGMSKTAILAYPSNEPYHRTLSIRSPYAHSDVKLHLVGIMLDASRRSEQISYLSSLPQMLRAGGKG